jgi:hypothetical protein
MRTNVYTVASDCQTQFRELTLYRVNAIVCLIYTVNLIDNVSLCVQSTIAGSM